MFDFSWSELAVIAAVALVVIGPKDLPRVMRVAGFWVRKARTVAHEFQQSLDQMIRESELEEVRKQVEQVSRFNIEAEIKKHVDPGGEMQTALQDPVLQGQAASVPLPLPSAPVREAQPAAPAPEPTTPGPASHDA
jgi:sec-independent protein translocase protein TatB